MSRSRPDPAEFVAFDNLHRIVLGLPTWEPHEDETGRITHWTAAIPEGTDDPVTPSD